MINHNIFNGSSRHYFSLTDFLKHKCYTFITSASGFYKLKAVLFSKITPNHIIFLELNGLYNGSSPILEYSKAFEKYSLSIRLWKLGASKKGIFLSLLNENWIVSSK